MIIAYPWEVDWAYLASGIVMPVLVWLFVFVVVVILMDIAVKSARRAQDEWFEENFGEATEAPQKAPEAGEPEFPLSPGQKP